MNAHIYVFGNFIILSHYVPKSWQIQNLPNFAINSRYHAVGRQRSNFTALYTLFFNLLAGTNEELTLS